jgi:CHASE3 domain sensor protein
VQSEIPERQSSEEPATATKNWTARKRSISAAAREEQRRSEEERARREQRAINEYHNPAAVWLGLAVVVILVVGGLFLINSMRCDPFFSDAGAAHSRSCR